MKISSRILVSSIAVLIIVSIISTNQINTFSSQNINFNNKKIANIAVLLNINDPYSLSLKQNLEDISKENADKIKFNFFDTKTNIAIQSEILDSLVKSDIDLFIVGSVDAKESTIEDIVNRVKQKNVPLILLGVDPQVIAKVSKDYDKVIFPGPDIKEAAILEGQILIDLWNTNKKAIDKNNDNILQYVLLRGEVNNPIATERTKYSVSTINDSGIKTQELALINSNWSEELAKNAIESLFLRYNGSIEAIIANNDAMAIGAIEALQKYGYNKGDKSKNIAVVGIDGLQEAKDLIDKGLMTGTVILNPKSFAEGLYAIAVNLINGENPLENTNFKSSDGTILIPINYQKYTGNTNIS